MHAMVVRAGSRWGRSRNVVSEGVIESAAALTLRLLLPRTYDVQLCSWGEASCAR